MSIIKHVTLQKIVAHDFRYDPRTIPESAWSDREKPCKISIRIAQLEVTFAVHDLPDRNEN